MTNCIVKTANKQRDDFMQGCVARWACNVSPTLHKICKDETALILEQSAAS